MTDTGPVPGEGLPENAGTEAVRPPHAGQPGEAASAAPHGHQWSTDAFLAPATPAFTFIDQPDPGDFAGRPDSGDPAALPGEYEDEDEELLMPGPQAGWADPQFVPPPAAPQHAAPQHPAPEAVMPPQPAAYPPPAADPVGPPPPEAYQAVPDAYAQASEAYPPAPEGYPAAPEAYPAAPEAYVPAPESFLPGVEDPSAMRLAGAEQLLPAQADPAVGPPMAEAVVPQTEASAGSADASPEAADAGPPHLPAPAAPVEPSSPRRPLNLGPPQAPGTPVPGESTSGVSVRSLADRGPTPPPMPPSAPQPAEPIVIPSQQTAEAPLPGAGWGPGAAEPEAVAEAPRAVPADEPGGLADLDREALPAQPEAVVVEAVVVEAVVVEAPPADVVPDAEPVAVAPVVDMVTEFVGEPVAPVVAEPVAVEPMIVEPVAVEPVAVEPIAAEPAAVEPIAVEPVAVEAVVVEPVTVEAVDVAPAEPAEPAAPESAAPEPVAVEPVAEVPEAVVVAAPIAPEMFVPEAVAEAPAEAPAEVPAPEAAPVAEEPPAAAPEPVAEPVAETWPEPPAAAEPEPEAGPALAEPQDVAPPLPEAVPEAVPEVVAEVVAEPEAAAEDPAPSLGGNGYDAAVRDAVHKVIRERRDIRNGFRPDPIPHEVLLRVLEAAHTAPSVGHSQPWDFVVIRSEKTREKMHELATRQRDAYASALPKARAKQFRELKIEAILETPVNIVVTADPTRGGRHTLGRHTQPQMAPYSSALAVENLWLAARAEGLGVGWVSFFDEREMVRELGLPEHLEVVAYLCVGFVDEFPEDPELVQAGWSKRRPLSWVVHDEAYGNRALPGEEPHDLLDETLRGIRPLDAKALGEAWERQKRMTKPSGALGMLEIISAQLSGLSRQCPPPIPEPAVVAIFAGDHGVHAQGVTAWPQEVTGQMVANFLGGGAVCNAFANQVGAEVCVVDVGVAGDLPTTPGLLPRKVRPGTDDFTAGPAMTRQDAVRAIEVGIETARDLVAAGNKALLTGEMGIGNTTASAALIAVYTGADPAEVTGRGTGINDEMLARKVDVVRRALELHSPDPTDPIGVLAAVGGLEHAAIVGLLLGGASLRTPVILDGVSAGAAALVARAIAPEALAACIAGHRSAEPGHVAALTKLGLRPLVDLDLRLGEGTGALLALPLVQSAARVMHEVATFDAAGVTEKG